MNIKPLGECTIKELCTLQGNIKKVEYCDNYSDCVGCPYVIKECHCLLRVVYLLDCMDLKQKVNLSLSTKEDK
jgi:hypothetical protein